MNDVCSLELLTNAVANRLTADEETALYDHLERCEACCARMEQLAGGEQWQQEAAALLTTDELDAAVPEPMVWSEVDFSVEHLEPSEDANVLGQLGGYDVLAIIGRGGMGVVLKAFDRELKRFVAIKALSPHLAHSSVARKRFAREAQAAAAVVNPHVIAIHHVQPTGRLPFLIMPLLTGESLAQRLKSRAPLELTEVLRIGMQAAAGLAAAHDQGLVHRDVKPANIFLEKGVERVVITDFGLARAADDVSMTRLGVVAGTPEYMSPEQARGEALDGRSDLFSLGCVVYEMATGVSPFRSESTIATLRRIVDDKPAAIASLAPELPPWFSYIVERLLSKDPAQRFASASEVALLLEQCLSHLQQPTSVPLPASLSSLSPPRYRSLIGKSVAASAFAFALILAGVLVVLELNKGTLTIESALDDVPIRIMQGERVVKSLTVSRDGKSTRIVAGQYTVEIEHSFDKAMVENGMVTLSRGGVEVVKVTQTDQTKTTVVSYSVRAILEKDSENSVEVQLKSLVDLIHATIDPESWNVDEVSVVPYPDNYCLVVRQTESNHKAISNLIEQLHELVESRMVTPKPDRLKNRETTGDGTAKSTAGHKSCPFCETESKTIRQEIHANDAWSSDLPASDELDAYMSAIRMLPDSSTERFKFYWSHLEHANETIADDSSKEIEFVLHEHWIANVTSFNIKELVNRQKLVAWIKNPEVPHKRKQVYLGLLGICGESDDIDMLKQMIEDRTNPILMEAQIIAYVSLGGPAAWDFVEHEILQDDLSIPDTSIYSMIRTVRFLDTHSNVIARDRLLQSLHLMLDRPSLADLVVKELIRMEDWSQVGTLVDLLKSADEDSKRVRLPIVQYLQACPLPEAAEELKKLREISKAVEHALQQPRKTSNTSEAVKDSAVTVPPIEFDILEKLAGNVRDSAESRFANEPSWASSSVVSNSTLDGIWDVVEINWCGQVWISNGAQVLIENGKWVGFDPHETEDPTQNISRDFAIGPDNEFCRIETDGKLRYLQPGRFRLEADQLWLAVQQCSLPSETPIRAIPTVSEPNVTYYRLRRRKAGGQEENTNVTRKQSGAKNSALFNRQTIEDITRIYNDNTAVLRRELFQPPIQDLTVEQMRAALRLAAEIETRDSRPKTGKLLEKFAESGILSRKNGELLSYGTHEMDENGNTIARMIVPTFLIVNADGPKDERGQLDKEPVVLTSLSLSYRKNGYASQTYEHLTEAKDTLEGFLKPGRELFDKEMK